MTFLQYCMLIFGLRFAFSCIKGRQVSNAKAWWEVNHYNDKVALSTRTALMFGGFAVFILKLWMSYWLLEQTLPLLIG